ncbi:hypothetical protein WH50_11825 [Pokkaliibacter plantistimulans]|uniref:DUF2868 domain-containing protein n=1 Tax=Pokkaliibacter plantistimulans TaxID=1635171 RepID=A0ABX5LZJ4_9GAMM|nr:DUF2868 domain-containing protein [Pokkaliibacter plantistimulans]PXF31070.1 hypothetical protein WH50_11825 [Pokkaliibacter plantistimulans]
MSSSPHTDSFALLVDFDWQNQRDQQLNPDLLHQRDRRIGLSLSASLPPREQARAWLARLHPNSQELPGQQITQRFGWVTAAIALLGVMTGISTFAGLLAYDGSQRINVLLILLLVLMQLVFTLLSCTVAARGVPSAPWFSSGRLAGLLSLLLPGDKSSLSLFHHQHGLKPLYPWLVLRFSQFFACAFSASALLCLLLNVTVQDLAFGWSTTLQISATTLHGLVSTLALPWQAFFPSAVPDLALIEQSRYFRLAGSAQSGLDNPALLGQWWPFIAMCWLSYALLPRIVLAIWIERRWRRRLAGQLEQHPGFQPLFRRLHRAWVGTASEQQESDTEAVAAVSHAAITMPKLKAAKVVHWADTAYGHPDLRQIVPTLDADDSYCAGGGHGLDQDEAVIEAFSHLPDDLPVVILVKAWEPPLAELQDFLLDLRNLNRHNSFYLLPINPGQKLEPAESKYLPQWQHFITRMDDAHLHLVKAADAD